jgi:hypothetical protein
MKPVREWSTVRTVLTSVGAILLFALIINGLHSLTRPEQPGSMRIVADDDVEETPAGTDPVVEDDPEAGMPVVEVIDGRTVRIEYGGNMHTQISIDDDPEGVERLAECIRKGIDTAAKDDTTTAPSGTTIFIFRGFVNDQVSRITQQCLAEHHGIPELPTLPDVLSGDR